jgi:hypothetical protein
MDTITKIAIVLLMIAMCGHGVIIYSTVLLCCPILGIGSYLVWRGGR